METLSSRIHCVTPPDGAEPYPATGEAPAVYVMRAAKAKAVSVASLLWPPGMSDPALLHPHAQLPPFIDTGLLKETLALASHPPAIIGADTIVVLDGEILGKPKDEADALRILSALSGRTHTVITGCSLLLIKREACREGQTFRLADCHVDTFSVESNVTFWECPHSLLAAYVRTREPMDKAGAYAVQGIGACLVRSVQGSWSNVVGLPLAELTERLIALGVVTV